MKVRSVVPPCRNPAACPMGVYPVGPFIYRVAPILVLKCVYSEGWHVQWEAVPSG